MITFSGNLRFCFIALRIAYNLLFSVSVIFPDCSFLRNASYSPSERFPISSLYIKSFIWTKYAPRRLSSAEVMRALFPTIIPLISVQNVSHVTPVSRISAPAKLLSTCSKLFSINLISHLRWNAVSSVKTFWSEVFIVPIIDKFDGIRTLFFTFP